MREHNNGQGSARRAPRRAWLLGLAMGIAALGCTTNDTPIAGDPFPPGTTAGTTIPAAPAGTAPISNLCAAAIGLAEQGQGDAATAALIEALKADPAATCAAAVITRLAPAEASCNRADALLAAGFPSKAADAYLELLKKPDLSSCSGTGLTLARRAQIRSLCQQAALLRDADQLDEAKTMFLSAEKLTTELVAGATSPASVPPQTGATDQTMTCAATGLNDVAHTKPAKDWRERLTEYKWWLLLLTVATIALGFRLWVASVRKAYANETSTRQFVPRVRVAVLGDGPDSQPAGKALPPVIKRLMRDTLSSEDLTIDVVQEDIRFDDLIAAVKEIDAKLAAWAQLWRVITRLLWPWSPFVLTGQVHESPTRGAGLSTWFAEGPARTVDGEFWAFPGGGANSNKGSAYDLTSAAAAWAVFEVSRATFIHDKRLQRPEAAVSHGYLVAANSRLREGDRDQAIRMLRAAEQADALNLGARTARLLAEIGEWRTDGDRSPDSYDAWLADVTRLFISFGYDPARLHREPLWGITTEVHVP